MRRIRRLAHRTEHQAGAGAVQKPHQTEYQCDGQVDHGVLPEQGLTQQGDVAQEGNRILRLLRQLLLHVLDTCKG